MSLCSLPDILPTNLLTNNAVGGLVHGAQLLARKTRSTLNVLKERAARVPAEFASQKRE